MQSTKTQSMLLFAAAVTFSSTLLIPNDCHAGSKELAKRWGLMINYAHFITSHLDEDTQTMVGETGPGAGAGGQFALLFKVSDKLSVGGNLDLTFQVNPGGSYTYLVILPNIGAALRVKSGKVGFQLMFDYVFGGVVGVDKGKLSCSGGICARGNPYSSYAGGPSPAFNLVFGAEKFEIGFGVRYTYLILDSVVYTMSVGGAYPPMYARAKTHYLQAGLVMHFGK